MTLTELAETIRRVVDYNWTDECNDYAVRGYEQGRTDTTHIFHDLVALDNWINSTAHTADSYITTEEEETP